MYILSKHITSMRFFWVLLHLALIIKLFVTDMLFENECTCLNVKVLSGVLLLWSTVFYFRYFDMTKYRKRYIRI